MADVDISKVFADPVFRGLSSVEKINAMDELDPEFKSLPTPKDKAEAIQSLMYSTPMVPKDQGFWTTLGKGIAGLPTGVGRIAKAPLATLTPGMREQTAESKQAFKEGKYSEAAGHFLAASLPGIGPAAASAGEHLGGGQTGQGAAETLMLLGPSAFRALPAGTVAKAAGKAAAGARGATGFAIDNLAPKVVLDALPPFLAKALRGVRGGKIMTPAEEASKLFENLYGRKPKGPEDSIAARNIRKLAIQEDMKGRVPAKEAKAKVYPAPPVSYKRAAAEPPAKVYPAPPVKFKAQPAVEEAPAPTPTAPAPTPTGSVDPTPKDLPPRIQVYQDAGAAKNSYLAQRFHNSGLTPEEVEIMPDAKFEMEMLKEGQELVKRGLLKSGYKKYDGRPQSRPYNVMKLEVADAMRKARGGE